MPLRPTTSATTFLNSSAGGRSLKLRSVLARRGICQGWRGTTVRQGPLPCNSNKDRHCRRRHQLAQSHRNRNRNRHQRGRNPQFRVTVLHACNAGSALHTARSLLLLATRTSAGSPGLQGRAYRGTLVAAPFSDSAMTGNADAGTSET